MPPVERRIEDVLGSTALFETVESSTMADLARASRLRMLQRNDMLFTVGERASALHVVDSGTLRVFMSSAEGLEPTLALIYGGETVGELGVLDDLPRSASVAAVERTSVVEMPARTFRRAYEADPGIARQLVPMLAHRLRTVTDGLADLAYLDLGGRLAKFLLRESERHGRTHRVRTG